MFESNRGRALALAAVAVLCPGPRSVAAQELHVDRNAANVVRFISQTTVDEFEGVTDRIDGYVLLDGAPLSGRTGSGDTELYLEVDLASIDTGIGLRNRHMRDNYLETDEHPYATYRGRIVGTEDASDGGIRVLSRGTFEVHGVARERELTCDVAPAGAGYRARCAFPVLLGDHDIEIPRVMFLRLADEVRVEVEFTVVPAGDGPGGKP